MASSSRASLPPYESAMLSPASWTSPQENFLIDMMYDKVVEGGANRDVGHFSKTEWGEFMKRYYERFWLKHDKKCFKNKVNQLKDRYKDFGKLLNDTTGLGWNEAMYNVDATPTWWDEYIKVTVFNELNILHCVYLHVLQHWD
ncbi:hypothetical protein ACHQM5_003049 [Ranunculus cassubicifolius]